MYYYGYFRSSDISKDTDGQLYKVIIITDFNNNGWESVGNELILNGNPFVVNYPSDNDNLFKPYKCSTATVSFFQKNINKDFYSVKGNDIYVALLQLKEGRKFDKEKETVYNDVTNYNVMWCGYATPNAYNQQYIDDTDLFQMECQDALSTLKYYDYTNIACSYLCDMASYITEFLMNTKAYKNIYITNAIKVPTTNGSDIFEKIKVNQENFINENDQPQKQIDVLAGILQYLNLTIIPYGNSVYIVDYNAIANEYSTYKHIYSNDTMFFWLTKKSKYIVYGNVQLTKKIDITPNLFANSDTNYSLGNIYNKVTVTDDYYFTSEKEKETKLVGTDKYSTVGSYKFTNNNKIVELGVRNSDSKYTELIDYNYSSASDYTGIYLYYYGSGSKYKGWDVVTYYWQNEFNGYYKQNDNDPSIQREVWTWVNSVDVTDSINSNKEWTYNTAINYAGANIVKESVHPNYYDIPQFNDAIYFNVATHNSITGSIKNEAPNISLYVDSEKAKQCKVISFEKLNTVVNSGDYLVMNGDVTYYMFNFADDEYNVKKWTKKETLYNFFWCEINYNGKYYNGAEWQDTQCVYKLELDDNFRIKTNVGYPQGLPYTGYGVKLPNETDNNSAAIRITFMLPLGLTDYTTCDLVVLRNFELDILSKVENLLQKKYDTNTEYTNNIYDGAIEEYNNITTYITTHTIDKNKDYSSSYLLDVDGNSKYLDYITNIVTGDLCKSEEMTIANICRQYSQPNIYLQCSLFGNYPPYSLFTYHFFNASKFVIDGQNIDYANNVTTLNLVEKIDNDVDIFISKHSKQKDYNRAGEIIKDGNSVVKMDGEDVIYTYDKYTLPTFKLDSNNGNLYITKYGTTTL